MESDVFSNFENQVLTTEHFRICVKRKTRENGCSDITTKMVRWLRKLLLNQIIHRYKFTVESMLHYSAWVADSLVQSSEFPIHSSTNAQIQQKSVEMDQ